MEDYNANQSDASLHIRKKDRIVEVNGVRGDCMRAELIKPQVLKLVVEGIVMDWNRLQAMVKEFYDLFMESDSKEESFQFLHHCIAIKCKIMGQPDEVVRVIEENIKPQFSRVTAALKVEGKTEKEIEAAHGRLAHSIGASIIKDGGKGEARKFLLACTEWARGHGGKEKTIHNVPRLCNAACHELETEGKAIGKSDFEIQASQDSFAAACASLLIFEIVDQGMGKGKGKGKVEGQGADASVADQGNGKGKVNSDDAQGFVCAAASASAKQDDRNSM